MRKKFITEIALAMILVLTLSGCTSALADEKEDLTVQTPTVVSTISQDENTEVKENTESTLSNTSDMFTDRDLLQSADLVDAVNVELSSGKNVTIDSEGVYVLTGDVQNTTVIVEVDDEEKVQLVLDGLNVINEDAPVIYVKSGDKVFVTMTESINAMEVSGKYENDGDTNLDAVIYSKSDLVLNGYGTLEIVSEKGNGVTSKDDLKITGGSYNISSLADALEANDSIRIYDGNISIVTDKDGLHSENEEDSNSGYIYIQGGTMNITAADDAITATSLVTIDGGSIIIPTCTEGIEGTYILINDGFIDIYATDDGINATSQSDYDVVIEVNGGTIKVVMATGDTDAFDANGSIFINGGTIDIEAKSSFDADKTAELNGGTVTVNGEQITEIVQMRPPGKGDKKK